MSSLYEEKNPMPLTALDPVTALIVIDLQKSIVNGNFIHPINDIVGRTRALIDVFHAKELPVVLVNVAGRAPGRTEQGARSNLSFAEGWTDLLPELDRQPSDILVTKRSWGAFATTDLEAQLKAQGVTQVVVTGVVTSGGVEATARQAYEQGFNVTLALDAMTDLREEAHAYSIQNVFPRLARDGVCAGNHLAVGKTTGKKEHSIMNWLWLVSYFFGGVFLANAVPHFVAGVMGHPFQSPFAKPPGKGLSSSTVNVVWGFFNAVVGYLLIAHVGVFHPRAAGPYPGVRHGRAAPQHQHGASFRTVPWGQRAIAQMNPAAGTFRSLRSFNFRLWDGRRSGVQHRHLDAACRSGLAGAHPS